MKKFKKETIEFEYKGQRLELQTIASDHYKVITASQEINFRSELGHRMPKAKQFIEWFKKEITIS